MDGSYHQSLARTLAQCGLKVSEVRTGPTLIWQSLTCSQQSAPIQWLLQLKLATERSMQPLLGQQAGLRETLDLLNLLMLAISCYYSCASSWLRFHGLGCLQFSTCSFHVDPELLWFDGIFGEAIMLAVFQHGNDVDSEGLTSVGVSTQNEETPSLHFHKCCRPNQHSCNM